MAKITVMRGTDKVGEFPMEKSPFVVGREAKGGVLIENVGVSRKHCQFVYEDGRYFVEDLGSSNGTYFSGHKVNKAEVRDGDQVNVGKYVLLFQDSGMEFLPQAVRGPVAGAPGGDAMLTFRVDPQTLREQMAKAGDAAAVVAQQEAKRAADIAQRFDPDAIKVTKKRKDLVWYVTTGLKLLGLGIIGAGVLIAILYATHFI
ncbi:MAG: FHA domain-containing protein [Planctomycetota bacterium]